jgi:hypothetical protein
MNLGSTEQGYYSISLQKLGLSSSSLSSLTVGYEQGQKSTSF